MSPKKTETSEDKRNLMIKLREHGKTYAEIAKLVDCSKGTVIYNCQKFQQSGNVKNKPRKGRPRKLSPRAIRALTSSLKENRMQSAKTLAKRVETSTGIVVAPLTVNRALKRVGLVSRVPRQVPTIRDKNVKKRIDYAKRYVDMPISFWQKALWTDESKFNVKKSDGRIRVWRSSKNPLEIGTTIRTFKHGNGSVMVWGCMSAAGTGNLVFIDGIMTKKEYLTILRQNVQQSATKLGIGDDFIFIQDNDPKHTAGDVKDYFDKKGWEVQDHPPQSPDLNVIEHLWDEIDRRIDRTSVNTIEQLKAKIIETWISVEPEVTKKLVDSMPRRLQAVIDAKGGNTRY